MSSPSSGRPHLTAEKRRLLAQLVQQKQKASVPRDVIQPADRARPLPLSFGQERLWFLDQLAPGNPFYNDCEAFRLRGRLDIAALASSLNRIIERHEILRTSFPTLEGRPHQRVHDGLRIELPVIDLSDLGEPERRARTVEIAGEDLDRPFDLTVAPLLRFELVRWAEDHFVLLFTLHHIIFDGWSLGVFVAELAAFYEAELASISPELPELGVQYVDFAAWQRERMSGDRLERQLDYWRGRLRPPLPTLELRTDHPRPEQPSFRGKLFPVELGNELSEAVRRLGRRENVTQFVALLAGYYALLHSLSGENDLIVGTPIANRTPSEIEPLLGFFLNTLALRTDLSGDPTFRQLLERVAETNTGASENQDLPFEKLVAELNPERQLNYNPFFQVWFTLLSAPMPAVQLHGLSLDFAEIETHTARFDLALILWQSGDQVRGHFEYSLDLYEESTVEAIAATYRTILDRAVQRPDARLSELVEVLDQRAREKAAESRRRRRKARAERLSGLRSRRRPSETPSGE